MRRSMTVFVVVVGLLGAVLVESASALRVRWDPKDSSHHDIRRVVTDRTPHRVVLWIGLWEPARPWGGGWILVPMDTHGTTSMDFYVTFQERRCRVQETTTSRGYIGHRYVRRRGERSIGCKLPLGWFDIDKTVRFIVVQGGFIDRAPDEGYYVGL